MRAKFDDVVAHGNRGFHKRPVTGEDGGPPSVITCTDGFTMSVIAGGGTYCTPRPGLCSCALGGPEPEHRDFLGDTDHAYSGPYTHVEVGFPSQRPEPWDDVWVGYAEDPEHPKKTVYGYVPVEVVRDLIASHGGEAGWDG